MDKLYQVPVPDTYQYIRNNTERQFRAYRSKSNGTIGKWCTLTPLEPQSRFGGKLVEI